MKIITLLLCFIYTPIFAQNSVSPNDIKITCDLISFQPCKTNKISAVIRVNIITKDTTTTDTWLLKAQQIVDIPCTKNYKISLSQFKKNARIEKTEAPLLPVLDYLNKNDKDGDIFEKIAVEIKKNLQQLDKK